MGELIPFCGEIVLAEHGRPHYEFGLGTGKWAKLSLDPCIKCSGTYVNDFGGPERLKWSAERAKTEATAKLNVVFKVPKRPAKPYQIFWKVLKQIAEGEALAGDYGLDYWKGPCTDTGHRSQLARLLEGTHSCVPIVVQDGEPR